MADEVRAALFESLVENSGRAKKYGYDLVDGLLADLRALPVEQRMEAMGMRRMKADWTNEDGDEFEVEVNAWVEADRG